MKLRILSLFFILLLLIPAFAFADGSRAVIANCKEYVTLRKSASSKAAGEIRMPLGEQVTVLERMKNGWAKVRYFDRTGYVPDKYLAPWKETAYTPRKSASGYPVYCGNYGTAKHIEDRTVVVAIFADDATTHWDLSKTADQKLQLRNRFNLSVGCTWLTEQTRRYRSDPGGFVWDWLEHSDLYYTHTFTEDIIHGANNRQVTNAIVGYIHENIPSRKLLEKYGADSIIYNVYLNAPNSQDYRSWTNAVLYNAVEPDKYVPEFCVIVPYGRGRENNPATLAHEMLHCFGAYDLYETNPSSPIPQKYVNYLMSHKPNDLMNRCYFSASDIVTVEFSEVDAYYVGLTDTCAAVKKWGLGSTIFQRWPAN